MSNKVAELRSLMGGDEETSHIVDMWSRYKDQMRDRIELWKEQRDYTFATDTSTTTNSSLLGVTQQHYLSCVKLEITYTRTT